MSQREERIQHTIILNYEEKAETGFMYTSGIADTHPSKVELITLDVPKGDMEKNHQGVYSALNVAHCFNFLADRLLEGHPLLPGQKSVSNGVHYMIVGLDDDMNRLYLTTMQFNASLVSTFFWLCPWRCFPSLLTVSLLVSVSWSSKLLKKNSQARVIKLLVTSTATPGITAW